VNFVPKLMIEVVVRSDRVDMIIDAISGAAKTGQIGDGKIFAFELEQAVRVRTGEVRNDAL
jgi:nitrogen regulatory protein P-II 2